MKTSQSESSYEARQRRAYRLYVGYKTSTFEYRRLAESFGLSSTGELNRQMWAIHNARRERRLARRKAGGALRTERATAL